ncbi:utrophin-like protein [Cricetulus griseus]|nr:utrophin-like protein [Cricetulus griseus]
MGHGYQSLKFDCTKCGEEDHVYAHRVWTKSQKFGKQHIDNLFSDLQDGKRLLDLLEGLTGQKLVREQEYEEIEKFLKVT